MSDAAQLGELQKVQSLLLRQPDLLDSTEGSGLTPLQQAAWRGRLEVVQFLLANNAKVDLESEEGQTALDLAVKWGHKEIADALRSHGAQPGSGPINHIVLKGDVANIEKRLREHPGMIDKRCHMYGGGRTPLQMAAVRNQLPVARLLLAKGANVNALGRNDRTPLHDACVSGGLELTKLLLASGADVNARDEKGLTPLLEAVHKADVAKVELLLVKGADANLTANDGRGPLFYASHARVKPALKTLLLEHGAQLTIHEAIALQDWAQVTNRLDSAPALVSAINSRHRTPLHEAADVGNAELVARLLDQGAAVDVCDNDGNTPLKIAASRGDNEIVAKLLVAKATVDVPDSGGRTALHDAVLQGNTNIVTMLLRHGANVAAADKKGTTPLHVAAGERIRRDGCGLDDPAQSHRHNEEEQRYAELIRLLAWHHPGCINARDERMATPLHRAAGTGSAFTVKALLDLQADVNVATDHGYTPLHCAAAAGRLETVELLIERGAAIDAQDSDGRTARQLAIKQKQTKVADFLSQNVITK